MSQSNQVIRYSRGSSKFDNKPDQKVAQTFDEFESEVLSDQSPKKGMAYICAPLNSGMHYRHPDKYEGEYHWRLKNHVCERNFLPFDCDWFAAPKVFQELLLFAERYRGFGYTTASHQSTAPRARLIFAASRPVTRSECEEVCRAIQEEMLATLGRNNVKLDESVYRGEQPVYTPVYTSQTYHFKGCLVDVDALLNKKYAPLHQKAPGLITMISPHTGFDAPDRVSDGEGREETILKYAGHIRARNVPEDLILKICLDYNQLHIFPPLDEATVLDRVNRYAKNRTSAPPKDMAWITPEEIGSSLPPVPKFEEKLLPAGFREWVYDIAERMQCPIEFLAVGAMVAAGAVVGNKIGIQPKQKDTGWVEVPNLWGAIVGRPGVMKTPALAEVLGPIKKIESEMQDAFALTKSKYEFDRFLYDATKKQLSSQIVKNGGKWSGELPQEPEQPQPQRIIVSDSTYQKLGQVLSGNPHGVLVFQDELSGLLKRLDSDGQDAARAFYLEAWNGKHSYTFDRVERGTIKISRLSISLLGGLQPTKLFEYLRGAVTGGAGDDGLAQRFQLLVYPDIKNVWTQVDRPPDIEAADKANSIFDRLAKIDPLALGAVQHYPGAIPVLRFDQTAQDKFNNWWSLLENDLRSTTRHPALESHLSKYRKLVPAMALLHHLIEARPGQVGVESLDCALRWHILLFHHAERCYAGVTLSNREGARLLLKHIKGNGLPDGFTVRDVYRKNWTSLSRKEDAIESIELLCDLGWLKGIRDERSSISDGRSTTRYFINPCIRSTV